MKIEFPPLKIVSFDEKEEEVSFLGINEDEPNYIGTDGGNWYGHRISAFSQGLGDMLRIEQLYEQIVELYEKYAEAETKNLQRVEKVVTELKADFGDYLMLNELKKEEK